MFNSMYANYLPCNVKYSYKLDFFSEVFLISAAAIYCCDAHFMGGKNNICRCSLISMLQLEPFLF